MSRVTFNLIVMRHTELELDYHVSHLNWLSCFTFNLIVMRHMKLDCHASHLTWLPCGTLNSIVTCHIELDCNASRCGVSHRNATHWVEFLLIRLSGFNSESHGIRCQFRSIEKNKSRHVPMFLRLALTFITATSNHLQLLNRKWLNYNLGNNQN